MEATTAKACKFILTTYNDGKNNKFLIFFNFIS